MIASHDISRDSERTTADEAPDASIATANVSQRTSCPRGAAVEGHNGDSPCPAAPSDISPRQRWAHLIVLNIINANLPLDRLADHLKIPFLTLIDYINTPEVRAEIDAYDQLLTIRARLLGQTARPISLRRLLDVLESPAPGPVGRDPESDQRALHRHAELIRRTATTIARESRAFAPKPAPKPAPTPAPNQRAQKGAPSASSGSSIPNDSNSRAPCPGNTENPAHSGVPSPSQSTVAEDARGCASPEPVDARTPQPTGSTDPANAAAHTAQPAPAPSEPPPSDPSPPASPRPSGSSRSSRSDASPPLRDSDSSAPSAFSSRSRHARDRPAA